MNCSTLATIVLLAAPAQLPGEPAEAPDSVAERRLKFLTDRFADYELFRAEDRAAPLRPTAEPVLRYSNPVRGIGLSDGVVYLWLSGSRPAAAACQSLRTDGMMFRELTLLGPDPLACVLDDQTIWTPAEGGPKWEALDAAEPAATKSLRLVQMRSIARRFAATYYKPKSEETFELRVLSQPLYRYEEEPSGVVDGAVFAFAEANDPEALLLLEVIHDTEGTRSWRYGLARMSSVRMIVRLDDREVWSVTPYWAGPRSPNDPYVEARDRKSWVDVEESRERP